ncbi:N-acetyltransferase mak3 [Fasciola gigantica]|uniref:N-acetyltransferase mak3 n=1 Tax=Fasciola gigantica TaxID=46835 RepID=A0A504YFF5_FASGI|nr:N-acetyltransferase mak3 [Fasciola gigantica]
MPELTAKITPDTSNHTRFTETQAGALICHDYEQQKYYRIFQSEIDLDIIRRYVERNLCTTYPDVTYRYFAMNWPELCIFSFTDTHIPIGLIIGQETEPHVGRITMFTVENRVEKHLVYRRLLELELSKMHEIGIRKVILKPKDERMKKKLLRYIGNAGPLRYVNPDGEFQFHI